MAEREAREATERTRREAPSGSVPRAEAELSKLAIAPKDLATLVRAEVERVRIAVRLDAGGAPQAPPNRAPWAPRRLGLHAPPADEQAQLALDAWSDRIAVVVSAALKATSWADLQAKIPHDVRWRDLRGEPAAGRHETPRSSARSSTLAGEKGAPDLRRRPPVSSSVEH